MKYQTKPIQVEAMQSPDQKNATTYSVAKFTSWINKISPRAKIRNKIGCIAIEIDERNKYTKRVELELYPRCWLVDHPDSGLITISNEDFRNEYEESE